jgi:hypothetical protein
MDAEVELSVVFVWAYEATLYENKIKLVVAITARMT